MLSTYRIALGYPQERAATVLASKNGLASVSDVLDAGAPFPVDRSVWRNVVLHYNPPPGLTSSHRSTYGFFEKTWLTIAGFEADYKNR